MSIEATTIDTITYEQPLNEPMRIYLQLEHLLKQLEHHLNRSPIDNSTIALSAIANILDIVKRPDLKSKLAQTLRQLATNLAQIEHSPQVNQNSLFRILENLDQLVTHFHEQRHPIAEGLRNNDFINAIRIRQNNPGGVCTFSTPAYNLWLHKPDHERIQDLKKWNAEFLKLRETVNLVLYIIRNSNPIQKVTAENGFYQKNLDPHSPCELIKVSLPTMYSVFPEFSVGKHRLSIYFLTPNFHESGRAIQFQETIPFELSCCRV